MLCKSTQTGEKPSICNHCTESFKLEVNCPEKEETILGKNFSVVINTQKHFIMVINWGT